jgi:anti-sigma-K factor RskA/putative zinc finger protein
MSDIHALSGAYAVDALDDIERAQFERHLAQCPACSAEVESLRETAGLLAETTAVAPSAALRELVLAGISTVRPLPPLVGEDTSTSASVASLEPRRRRRMASFLVAAAAAVAIGTGGVVWQQLSDDSPDSQYSQVLEAGDAQRITVDLDGGAKATLVRSEKLDMAVLRTEDMPEAPAGHSYALWLLQDGVMVPAGMMPEGPDHEVVLGGDAATATGAAISIEDSGKEPTKPTGDPIAEFPFGDA